MSWKTGRTLAAALAMGGVAFTGVADAQLKAIKTQTNISPTERKQVAVTRAVYAAGGAVPAGSYINVVFATRFGNAAEPVRELVSFHLDDDKTWRVSGYSVR